MTRKFSLLLALIAIGLLLAFSAPSVSAGTEYPVTINNKNNITIQLTFVGLKVYQFNLPPGKTTVNLERGPYQHSYYGCGQLNFDTYTVKLKDNEITVENCNKGGGTVSTTNPNETVFSVRSRSNKDVTVTLLGQETYQFTVPAFSKTEIVVVKGPYQLSYYECGKLNIETVRIKRDSEYTIKNCQEPPGPEAIDPNTKLLLIHNDTFQNFTIFLHGLNNNADYDVEVRPGVNRIYVQKGSYYFSYFACSRLHYGTFQVTARGAEMDIGSCGSILNGQAQTNSLAQFKVKNNTGDTLIVQLNGQIDYLFVITNGGEVLTAEKGFYQYTLWGCGTKFDGVIKVGPPGQIIRSPFCSNTSP